MLSTPFPNDYILFALIFYPCSFYLDNTFMEHPIVRWHMEEKYKKVK